MKLGDDKAPTGVMITLTPLIDVVFILLIFFKLASSFIDWRALDLRLAGASDTATQSASKALLVVMRPHGVLTIGDKVKSLEQALEAVRNGLAEKPDLSVILRPEAEVSLQEALDLMDSLKAAGAQDVALARESGAP